MAIKKLKVSNFRSFDELEVELSNLNVLIGANASGKSNFVYIFKFLADIADHGLDNAISLQGGVEYFRNAIIGPSKDFSLRVSADQEFGLARKKEGKLIGIRSYQVLYEIVIKFKKRGRGFDIREDKLTTRCRFHELASRKGKIESKADLGSGEIILSNVNGRLGCHLNLPEGVPIEESDIFPPFLREEKLPPRTPLLETHFFHIPPFFPFPAHFFANILICDFDPKLPKKASPITGRTELEADGSNLSTVLKNILEDRNKRRKFSNLINDLLPFATSLGVERLADKSLLFKLREKYTPNRDLPASLLSDGTINITALIVALYFEARPIIIIEEPDRSIHPFLISRVVDMLKEASKKKQIIITSHNPEIVKHIELKDLLLVSRSKDGFSTISKPGEKEEVKTFLRNEIGIEDLYVQDLLGV